MLQEIKREHLTEFWLCGVKIITVKNPQTILRWREKLSSLKDPQQYVDHRIKAAAKESARNSIYKAFCKIAKSKGFAVYGHASFFSNSQYLTATNGQQTVKIRISNHNSKGAEDCDIMFNSSKDNVSVTITLIKDVFNKYE
jgi:hypothetical protein